MNISSFESKKLFDNKVRLLAGRFSAPSRSDNILPTELRLGFNNKTENELSSKLKDKDKDKDKDKNNRNEILIKKESENGNLINELNFDSKNKNIDDFNFESLNNYSELKKKKKNSFYLMKMAISEFEILNLSSSSESKKENENNLNKNKLFSFYKLQQFCSQINKMMNLELKNINDSINCIIEKSVENIKQQKRNERIIRQLSILGIKNFESCDIHQRQDSNRSVGGGIVHVSIFNPNIRPNSSKSIWNLFFDSSFENDVVVISDCHFNFSIPKIKEISNSKAKRLQKLSEVENSSSLAQFQPLRDLILLNCVGVGGFSEVWEVLDPVSLTIQAVKMMRLPSCSSSDSGTTEWYLSNIAKEVLLQRRIKHPNLLSMARCFRLDGGKGFATVHELCATDLSKVLREYGALSETLTRNIFKQLLTAVKELHSNLKIVHLDIKPQNILIKCKKTQNSEKSIIDEWTENPPLVKLADFGLHEPMDIDSDGCRVSSLGGTPSYLPPECLLAIADAVQEFHLTAKADCWSLGICFLEMATGAPPFSVRVSLSSRLLDLKSRSESAAMYLTIAQSLAEKDTFWTKFENLMSPSALTFAKSMVAVDLHSRSSVDELLSSEFMK